MEPSCREFRSAWLRAETPEGSHPSRCPECSGWARSAGRVRDALLQLDRLSAPVGLETRVEEELSGDRSRRLRAVLESTARHAAPGALDERVASLLADQSSPGDELRGERNARVLRVLELQSAPGVLERLLREELGDPTRHRAERFPGSLERLTAPEALEKRVGSRLNRRVFARLAFGPLTALAAAGLIIWIAVRSGGTGSRPYRFQVIQASSLEGMDPMARAIAESLGGRVGSEGPR